MAVEPYRLHVHEEGDEEAGEDEEGLEREVGVLGGVSGDGQLVARWGFSDEHCYEGA